MRTALRAKSSYPDFQNEYTYSMKVRDDFVVGLGLVGMAFLREAGFSAQDSFHKLPLCTTTMVRCNSRLGCGVLFGLGAV